MSLRSRCARRCWCRAMAPTEWCGLVALRPPSLLRQQPLRGGYLGPADIAGRQRLQRCAGFQQMLRVLALDDCNEARVVLARQPFKATPDAERLAHAPNSSPSFSSSEASRALTSSPRLASARTALPSRYRAVMSFLTLAARSSTSCSTFEELSRTRASSSTQSVAT